jgi:hypothetical protein
MTSANGRTIELVALAEQAYRRARVEVFDELVPGARVDVNALTARQRDAFDDLIAAEAELANYRFNCHGNKSGSGVIVGMPAALAE